MPLPQATERRQTSLNHPASMSQLAGVYCSMATLRMDIGVLVLAPYRGPTYYVPEDTANSGSHGTASSTAETRQGVCKHSKVGWEPKIGNSKKAGGMW